MSLANEDNDFSDINQNHIQPTSQEQQIINQAPQPWNQNHYYMGNQWYPYMPFPISSTPNMNCMMNPYAAPQTVPYYQFQQPYYQQFPPQAFMPAETGFQWATANSQHFINNPAHTGNASLTYGTQAFGQDWRPQETNAHVVIPSSESSTGIPDCTPYVSSTCETQSSVQDFVPPSLSDKASESNSASETASGDNAGSTIGDQTRIRSVSLSAPSVHHSSPCHIPDCTANVSSTGDIQHELNSTSSSESEKLRKSNHPKCQCPNCRAEGGNQSRYPCGALKHVCHIPGCERVFPRPASLIKHLGWHKAQKNFFCVHCSKGFSSELELCTHEKTHDDTKPSSSYNCNSKDRRRVKSRRPHACRIRGCGKVYDRRWRLREHLERHRVEKKFFCAQCGRGFALKDILERHVNAKCRGPKNRSVNKIILPKTTSPEIEIENILANIGPPPTCPIDGCRRVFCSRASLKVHLRMHYDLQPYVCTCGKKFTHECYLRQHAKSSQFCEKFE